MSDRNFCERCGKRISALEWDIHTCTPPAQTQQEQAYKSVNPLGGPAKVFDAMANAIRAGDAYHAVLRQYGFTEVQPQQEPVAWMASDDPSAIESSPPHPDVIRDWIPLYTSPSAQRKPTDEMVVAAARMLSDRQAAACNVDCGDMWKLHGNDFIDDARAALESALGITGEQK